MLSCAVEVKGKLKTNLLPIFDDHVPIEISRFVCYSLAEGCSYNITISDTKVPFTPFTGFLCHITKNFSLCSGAA